jgi:hypothetical protein
MVPLFTHDAPASRVTTTEPSNPKATQLVDDPQEREESNGSKVG